jgi:hypothetical protein
MKEITKYEKIKLIAEKVWAFKYIKHYWDYDKKIFKYDDNWVEKYIDYRTIIFNYHFWWRVLNYSKNHQKEIYCQLEQILEHLNNPVEYLYNLIFNNPYVK